MKESEARDIFFRQISRAHCKHQRLGFASGGYYVQCMDCSTVWGLDKWNDDNFWGKELTNQLTMWDLRCDPNLLKE